MVRKKENAGSEHFSLFPQYFPSKGRIFFLVIKGPDYDETNYQTTNFGPFQTERVFRRQFQI